MRTIENSMTEALIEARRGIKFNIRQVSSKTIDKRRKASKVARKQRKRNR